MSIKKIVPFFLLCAVQLHCSVSKPIQDVVTVNEVTRIESTLSADDMEGRKALSPGIEKAASFISAEMKKAGLKPFQSDSYLHPFTIQQPNIQTVLVNMDDSVDSKIEHAICKSSSNHITITQDSSYKIVRIKTADDLSQLRPLLSSNENVLAFIDKSLEMRFQRIKQSVRYFTPIKNNLVFVLTSQPDAKRFSIDIQQQVISQQTSNVVGMLPGKEKPNEYVIFSAHYDHLGFGKADAKGDSLYNGANDDASGTTAVLMLAQYFAANKEARGRSILFVAFSAEELGTIGSQVFATTIDPASVVAMFNIEMIGTQSKWGKNSAYITGYERSDLGKMMQNNLKGSPFNFHPDPYTQFQLFYRSDNASLAMVGVPAHTISTSQMDQEPHYHKPSDEVSTLDMSNMMEIIKSIALASKSIVEGKEAPTRIEPAKLGSRQ